MPYKKSLYRQRHCSGHCYCHPYFSIRAIAPAMCGSIYSWSLENIKGVKENTNALGFPLNQYMAFFVLSIIFIISGIIVMQLPKSLDEHNDEPNEDDEENLNSDNNGSVTTVAVAYHTITSHQ